jgi:hypothetical protein
VLREPETRDRASYIELLASPEVGTYLGGPGPRDELEREMSGAPERRPGLFIVELDGAMIGQIILGRAIPQRTSTDGGLKAEGRRVLFDAAPDATTFGSRGGRRAAGGTSLRDRSTVTITNGGQ